MAETSSRPEVRWVPLLVRVLLLAVLSVGVMTGAGLVSGQSLDEALSVAGGAFPVQAVWWTVLAVRRRREVLRGEPAGLTAEQRQLARRASVRGPIPEDPVVRAEAARLAQLRYQSTFDGGSAKPLVVLLSLIGIGTAIAAFVSSPWYVLLTALCGLLAAAYVRYAQTGEARINALRGPLPPMLTGPPLFARDRAGDGDASSRRPGDRHGLRRGPAAIGNGINDHSSTW